jgi:hypothetical protein
VSPDRRVVLQTLAGALATVAALPARAQTPTPDGTIPRLAISPETAARVGQQVWQNESGRSIAGLTAWNDAEDFPSLGIGHWIWFKAGGHPVFEESFPRLLVYMRERGAKLPAWLDKPRIPPCPWQNKADFQRQFNGPELTGLRRFLVDTIPLQTQFLLVRADAAIPRMLATLPEPADRRHLIAQLDRLVRSSPDLYPLIDYVNFKGEGISPKETFFDPATRRNEGWGTKHLLLEMKGSAIGPPALAEFSRSAKYVLDRRIRNHPPSKRWQAGWHKRCETYRRPLGPA